MHSISGVPDKLSVANVGDFIKSLDDDISRLSVLKDELVSFQQAKLTLEMANAAKKEADDYAAKIKADADALKKEVSEKLAKVKKRELENETVAVNNKADREAIKAEKDGVKAQIEQMWDGLKADIAQIKSDQLDIAQIKEKLEKDRADLDARIAKFQATAASLSQ